MKVYVFDETTLNEKKVGVRLQPSLSGDGVTLVAVDETGERVRSGSLLTITARGKIRRHSSVNPTLGFERNAEGYIKLSDE